MATIWVSEIFLQKIIQIESALFIINFWTIMADMFAACFRIVFQALLQKRWEKKATQFWIKQRFVV